MKKVLFIQDSYFYKDDYNQFFSVHIDNKIINRYLKLGDHITFLGRTKKINSNKKISNKLSPLDSSKCSVIGLPNFKTINGYIKYYNKVKKKVEIAVEEHDIIMPRIPSSLGRLAVKYAKKHKKPIIGEIVGCTWDGYWNYNLLGKIIAPYFFFKQKQIVKELPYAIYVTNEFLQKRYPTKGKNTNCSNVVIEEVDPSILEKRLNKIQNLKNGDTIKIGTIAGLDVPFKGQKYVLQAISRLNSNSFLYNTVGNGKGNQIKRIAKELHIQGSLRIIGPIKHNEINIFLDKLDLYIQPSKQEGLPRALIEAMSRGLPAIGSRTGGIPELLKEEFIFEKANSKQLANIIKNYDKNKMITEALINFNKAKEYSINKINNRRNKFYKMFLNEVFSKKNI